MVAYTFINNGVQAVVVPMATCLCAMIGREIWQYKTGQAKFFEWDDIALYAITITFTNVLCGMLFATLGAIE